MGIYKKEKATTDGRKYFFKVSWYANGKRNYYTSKAFKLYDDCKKAEARFLLSLNKKQPQLFTFNEMIDEFLDWRKPQVKPTAFKKIVSSLAHTRVALGNVRIEKLTKSLWSDFLEYLKEQKMMNSHRNVIIGYTLAVLKYVNQQYDIYTNIPSKFQKFNEKVDVPIDKKMSFWTPQQFNTFISIVDDVPYRTLFTLLYATGVRSGEALSLYWSDVDFQNKTISISKTITTKLKGHKFVILPPKTKSSNRTIRVPQIALERLLELYEQTSIEVRNSPQAFVFGTDKPIPNSTLQKKKKHFFTLAQQIDSTLPEIRLHDFRHSCASALIHSGATIVFISKYLGHSSTTETLNTYSHFFPSETEFIATKMDDLLQNGGLSGGVK